MLQKILIIGTALLAFIANMAQAHAQLSSNPWLEANDEQAIEDIYKKHRRRHRNHQINYQENQHITIDRTHAYIQSEEMKEYEKDKGVFEKIKDKFNHKHEKEPLIPATRINRQALARQNTHKDEIVITAPSNPINNLKKSLRLPKIPDINVDGMIRKFERASGIDLKAIGNQLK